MHCQNFCVEIVIKTTKVIDHSRDIMLKVMKFINISDFLRYILSKMMRFSVFENVVDIKYSYINVKHSLLAKNNFAPGLRELIEVFKMLNVDQIKCPIDQQRTDKMTKNL